MNNKDILRSRQEKVNSRLLQNSAYMREEIKSEVLPFRIDIRATSGLDDEQVQILQALEIEAAKTAILSLESLATINELDHLGGGLDLIPALTMTLAITDFDTVAYTIEHAHTSIGYYSCLATYGFIDREHVINRFRRSIDIPGHVSWLPGGTQLNGGRLGVMIPAAVGQALGKRALLGNDAWVVTHCGDAGWISGQALNGFNGADLHGAPITFVMHRNGIQLSGATSDIMDKDPRPIIEALGIDIIETQSLHDVTGLYAAYREAKSLAKRGRPSLIYPTGYDSANNKPMDLEEFARMYGIQDETREFAGTQGVSMDTRVWVPGALMSYRDIVPMLENLFLVNKLPGGAGHHDGHMKGRDAAAILDNPMMKMTEGQLNALGRLTSAPPRVVTTHARPAPGSQNLRLSDEVVRGLDLPVPGKKVSARAGSEAAYAAVASEFPESVFVVSCDLDPSTKLLKARKSLGRDHQFEMSIEEQIAALMANGLAMSSSAPQLTVFSTFAAFFEGIAREGFEMWRYQRNLNGANEGLNVAFHLSHVGACTGRDHFSGWGLDWISLAIGYLPYLHRFYAPADARAAFIAVRDLAAHYGGHIIGIPRDVLPILSRQDSNEPLWQTDAAWEPITKFRSYEKAEHAILAIGAPAYLAELASAKLTDSRCPTDVYIVNGLPLPEDSLATLFRKYRGGIVTVEDGIIATRTHGLRGFASVVSSASYGCDMKLDHVGIVDPRVAPSDGHEETWEHFGLTAEVIVECVKSL